MNEIDRLMSLDPEGLSSQDLKQLIAYYRHRRDPSSEESKAERPKIDLRKMGLIKDKKIVRRF